jgi:hypothetical protein
MKGVHARGSGPAIGDHVTLTHEASGSVVHGLVKLRPPMGLVVEIDGCIVDLEREGWHVTQATSEPPVGAVIIDDGGVAQRFMDGWWYTGGTRAFTWAEMRTHGDDRELIWEPKR